MKIFKFGIAILSIAILIVSCGKPTTPESLNPVGDGGYKIVTQFQTSAFAQDVTKKISSIINIVFFLSICRNLFFF